MPSIPRRHALLLAFAAIGAHLRSRADAGPLRIVVPFAAGSAPDTVARTLAEPLAAEMGVAVVVENMPGAGGMVGVGHVARAPADGRTVVLSGDAALVMPDPQGVRRYEPLRDLAPISRVVSTPNVLVVGKELGVTDVAGFLAWLRRQAPGHVSYASAGVGTSSHRAGELLATRTGAELIHVPFVQSPLPDVLAGRVQLFFANIATAMPLVREGRLVALAVSSARRSPIAPDLPTLSESGLPGFEATAWFGLLAPAGTPPEQLERWQRGTRAAVSAPAVQARLLALGIEPVGSTAAELRETIELETRKWAALTK
jgi:tripartite-type tricarboxylate transporter receptor subunit TctC